MKKLIVFIQILSENLSHLRFAIRHRRFRFRNFRKYFFRRKLLLGQMPQELISKCIEPLKINRVKDLYCIELIRTSMWQFEATGTGYCFDLCTNEFD